jgi:hypothetical protein
MREQAKIEIVDPDVKKAMDAEAAAPAAGAAGGGDQQPKPEEKK